jgi:hypothetical protein
MPRLWFVYPLNGSGRRNPDAADRGQDSCLFISCDFEKGTLPEATCEPPYRSGYPMGRVCQLAGYKTEKRSVLNSHHPFRGIACFITETASSLGD